MSGVVLALLRHYARGQAAHVAPFVLGRRALDLGAGEGYVAAALREATGVWTCAVDVGGFRRGSGPYVVYDGGRLPFADDVFDTTLLLLTLHHCPAPETVLGEAVRVTRRRLIVTESVYRTRLERFWLDLLDGPVNARRHGGRMSPARHVRRPEAWLALFEQHGLSVLRTMWLGSRWEHLVHHPLLFVLDKPAPTTLGAARSFQAEAAPAPAEAPRGTDAARSVVEQGVATPRASVAVSGPAAGRGLVQETTRSG